MVGMAVGPFVGVGPTLPSVSDNNWLTEVNVDPLPAHGELDCNEKLPVAMFVNKGFVFTKLPDPDGTDPLVR